MKHLSKLSSFFAFPIFVYLIHLITKEILKLYALFPKIDIPFHYMGGFAIAFTSAQILSYLEKQRITPVLNRVLFFIMVVALTATAATFWEFAEFISDQVFNTHLQPSIANTMQDQFIGILGGATWAFIYYRKMLE